MVTKRNAFSKMYADYYTLMFSTLYGYIENTDEANDICQDVFIKLYEKFEEVREPKKWLYGALRLSVLEHYRKKNKTVDIDSIADDITMTFINGFRDARIIVKQVLDSLDDNIPAEDRTLFDLIAVYGYSYSEAGSELGFTKRIVEYRYRKTVDMVLSEFKKKGILHMEDLL